MATQRIERQGSASEHAAFTGAQGEVTYDSDLKTERSHDGSQVGGFLQHKAGQPTEVGGDTALSLSDFGGFVNVDTDTSSGDVTVTLPATANMPAGWEVLIRKGAAANTLTIATDASETIDGGSTLVLTGLGEYAVIRFDGSNFLALGTIAGVLTADPEHATDGGTDAYASATNTTPPGDGVQIVRDFQSANTTTTPELDSKVITDRDGNALWSGAISGVHSLQYDSGADTYLLLYPIGTDANVSNAPVKRDGSGNAKGSDPVAAQDFATKAYADSLARKIFHAQDQKTSGTAGGGSGATTTQTRDLNTVVTNEITGASLTSNQVTLPAGTYYIEASAPAYRANGHKLRPYNDTDSSYITELLGTSEYADASNLVQTRTFSSGNLTIGASKTIEIRHYTNTSQGTNGLGNQTGTGDPEVYADLKIWRIA